MKRLIDNIPLRTVLPVTAQDTRYHLIFMEKGGGGWGLEDFSKNKIVRTGVCNKKNSERIPRITRKTIT